MCVCVFEKIGVSVADILALGHHHLPSFRLVCPWSAALLCTSLHFADTSGLDGCCPLKGGPLWQQIQCRACGAGEKALGRSRSGSTGGEGGQGMDSC